MSEDKHTDNDSERTLLTLDQLSQTIEVMTSVVNRLRQHLSEQLKAQAAAREEAERLAESAQPESSQEQSSASNADEDKESFVVEIKQSEAEPVRKNSKTLH